MSNSNVIEFLIKGNAVGAIGAFTGMDDALGKLSKGLKLVAVAAAAVKMAKFVGEQIEIADQMGKLSQKTGIAVEQVSQLTYAFSQSEISAEAFGTSMRFLNKTMAEAEAGNKQALAAFKSLGISFQEIKGLAPEQALMKISNAFSGAQDGAAKSAIAMRLFGRAGAEMIPALNEGSAGINKLMLEADRLGLTVSASFAQQADRFGDNLHRMGQAGAGFARQLGAAVLPALNATLEALTEVMSSGDSAVNWGKVVAGAAGTIGVAFTALVAITKMMYDTVYGVFNSIGTLVGGVAASIMQAIQGDFSGAAATMGQTFKDSDKIIADAMHNVQASFNSGATGIDKIITSLDGVEDKTNKVGAAADAAGKKKLNFVDPQAEAELDKLLAKMGDYDSQLKLIMNDAQRLRELGASELKVQQFINEQKLQLEIDYQAKRQSLIDQSYLTEADKAATKLEQDILQLQMAREQKLITDDQYDEMAEQAKLTRLARMGDMEAQARLNQIRWDQITNQQRLDLIKGYFGEAAGLMQSGNHALFSIGKAAAYANALISGYQAIQSGFATAPFFPTGLAMGALAIAKTGMQLSGIKGAQISGQAHAGMTNVPNEGTFLLDKGERVISPDQNKDLTSFLDDGGSDGGGIQIDTLNIHILENATNADALLSMPDSKMREVIAAKVIPALDVLDGRGIRPRFVQRLAR